MTKGPTPRERSRAGGRGWCYRWTVRDPENFWIGRGLLPSRRGGQPSRRWHCRAGLRRGRMTERARARYDRVLGKRIRGCHDWAWHHGYTTSSSPPSGS